MSYSPEHQSALMREVWLSGWMAALETVKEGKSLDELLEHAEEYYQNGIKEMIPNLQIPNYSRALSETAGKCRCGEPGRLIITIDSQKGFMCPDCLTAMRNDSL